MTNLVSEEIGYGGPDNLTRVSIKYKNGWTGNHVDPTPYTFRQAVSYQKSYVSGTRYVHDAPNSESMTLSPYWSPVVLNKAYSDFKESINGKSSELGAFLAEGKQSLGMIRRRADQMRQAYLALRRGDISRFLKTLGVPRLRRHKPRLRRNAYGDRLKPIRPSELSEKIKNSPAAASNMWLEYWFGWAPMCGDIYNALGNLSEPLPYGPYKGTFGTRDVRANQDYPWAPQYIRDITIKGKVGAEVALVNPNQYLRSQLGLANPFATAWEVIPFSFLIDWVTGVGSYIESFTDFYGLDVRRAYYTLFQEFDDLSAMNYGIEIHTSGVGGVTMRRETGLYRPAPNLSFQGNLGVSLTRAASSVALLVQALKS